MDRAARRLRGKARTIGLNISGPYTGGVYALWEAASGDLLGDGLDLDAITVEIVRHRGVPRLADARRRRRL